MEVENSKEGYRDLCELKGRIRDARKNRRRLVGS